MNGDKRIDAPITEEIAVVEGTKVVFYGTSFKGAKVTVTVGNVGKLAEIDTDGNWTFTVDNSLLVEDSVSVFAQAQDNTDKNSTVVALAKLKKAPVAVAVANTETRKPWYQDSKILMGLLALGLLVLAALGGLLYYLIKHRKPKGSVTTPEKTV
jgi:VCBS repeat-containing protein